MRPLEIPAGEQPDREPLHGEQHDCPDREGLADRAGRAAPDEPLGLYISVPFCRAKCTFCNFASGVYPSTAMPAYVAALRGQLRGSREWARLQRLALPERVDTIYLGGGTPSLLPPALLAELLAAIRAAFAVDRNAEITLEAAPLQLEPATLEAALAGGVNRVSFGVQSFVAAEARATARTHSGDEALAEIARMRAAGVAHVSADVIAGLPGQSGASWAFSVEQLCASAVDHASVYMFELDEDSRLGAEALRGGARFGAQLLPREDAVADWYEQACAQLAASGLAQYEISNFARPCGVSRHNQRYWLRQPYLGLGVDAHSMLRNLPAASVGLARGGCARFAVSDELEPFLAGGSWDAPVRLTHREELEEAFFLGLRRNAGLSIPALAREFSSEALAPFLPILTTLTDEGLLVSGASGSVALTARGRLLSNEVFGELLLAEHPALGDAGDPLPDRMPPSLPLLHR